MRQIDNNKNEDIVVIKRKQGNLAPYRVYSPAEVEVFLAGDTLPQDLLEKVQRDIIKIAQK